MNQMLMLARLAVLAGTCFLLVLSRTALAGEPSMPHVLTHHEQGLDIADEAPKVFIKYGLCADSSDCSKKEFGFYGRSGMNVAVELYEIRNIDVISEVIKLCLSEYERSNRKLSINIVAYKEPHRNRVNTLFKWGTPKPYIVIDFKGEQ